MQNFTYYAPTKVIFGRGVEENVGEALKAFGPKKVLIHYGGGSAKRSGLIGKITDSLDKAGIAWIELGGVEPNPKVQFVREAIALCRKEGVDFLLAVGGGSAIDSAKSIALSIGSDADPWDIVSKKVKPTAALPVGVVLTIAAAGSEMSDSHVLSDLTQGMKRGFSSDLVRPKIAFMNPELTYTVSPYQTACGIVDIMMHTLERYFGSKKDNPLTDRVAEGIMQAVIENGPVALAHPDDFDARGTLMWASSLSHNGLTGCGGAHPGMPVHQLEHGVSGLFDNVSHGAGLAILFPAWASYMCRHDVMRFCQAAVRIWNVPMDYDHPERTARRGIQVMKEFFHSLGMPVSLHEVGIGPESFEELAKAITYGYTRQIPSFVPMGKEEILDILRLAE